MPTAFPPPVNVSPLIKFCRWSFLLTGIAYGAFWQSRYTSRELSLKDVKTKEKAARDAKLAEEKARNAAAELENIAKMLAGTSK
ncbi:ATP synthase, subunit E [Rhodnius prolixus]|uniref:ATP synthase F(0) complex subunit e, mitochondrial n=2 Tax=Rhodnius TaxID=13248 RepID=R4FJJ6_RHOPR